MGRGDAGAPAAVDGQPLLQRNNRLLIQSSVEDEQVNDTATSHVSLNVCAGLVWNGDNAERVTGEGVACMQEARSQEGVLEVCDVSNL